MNIYEELHNDSKYICPLCKGHKFKKFIYISSSEIRSTCHATPQEITVNKFSWAYNCKGCGIILSKRTNRRLYERQQKEEAK